MKILTNDMSSVKDNLALLTFGISFTDAQRQKICIDCKKPIADLLGDTPSKADLAEYQQSSLCPKCFSIIDSYEEGPDGPPM